MPVTTGRRAGIDVGGTKCLGVVWQDGQVLHEVRRDTPECADDIIETLVSIVRELGEVESVGIGVPGLVTRQGVLRAAPNLVDIADFAVKQFEKWR